MNKRNLRNAIRTRNCQSLTDIRTVFFLKKQDDRYSKFPNRQRVLETIFKSDLSWQKRKIWIDNIIDWTGPRGENFEWQCVLHNSKEVAESLLSRKSERASGENNPGYNHGGKLSIYSEKFIGDVSKKDAAITKMKETKKTNPKNENTKIEYYLDKGFGLCESINKLKDRQAVGRLDKFIERYGEVEGRIKWEQRQEKWIKSYNDKSIEDMALINSKKVGNGYTVSVNEKEIITKISDIIGKELINTRLTLPYNNGNNFFVYDLCYSNKVVEYNGDYWHCNPSKYNETYYHQRQHKTAKEIWEKDLLKKETLYKNGYELLVIWETDYEKDKEGTIKKCLDFLTQ